MKINTKLLKVAILVDIIEAEIVAICPSVNIGDVKTMYLLSSLQGTCKRYRNMFDDINDEFAEKVGELSDIIDEQIESVL